MARFEFSRVSGWRNSFAPGILLVFLAGLAVALATGHLYSVRQSRHWISHSHEVIEATQALAGLVQDVESGERGFIVTGDNRFLSTFDRSRSMVPAAAAKLEALVREQNEAMTLLREEVGRLAGARPAPPKAGAKARVKPLSKTRPA